MRTRNAALLVIGLVSLLFAYAGTGGSPLGGLGTGYITYNAVNNTFKKGTQPSGWYAETQLTGGFHFYTNVNGTVATRLNATTGTEDAKIPIYTADYAALQNVHFTLLAFAPINSGDEKLASLPLAFFEFTVTNNNASAADAAVAWQFSPFEGGAAVKITNGISWPGTQNTAMLASVDSGAATISTGSATSEFTGSGVMGNGAGNILGVKVSIPAGQSARIRFVYAWYRSFGNGENFYYYNYYTNSQDIATYGMQNFNTIRDGAKNIVTKTMASNLPDWFKDRLLNNLYPLFHNVQMAQDGRVAVREGCFPIIGTLDQQGHAQNPLTYWFPDHNWRQMRFWAHTQYSGGTIDGGIHHDVNGGSTETMCAWDNSTHTDYRASIDTWGDLNLHFIIGTYELFLASANIDSLTALWPYLKRTGNRSIIQCGTGYVPVNCLSSYDRTGATDIYNGSLALVAYQAMADMATIMNDQAEATKWRTQVTNAKAQFLTKYWNATFGTGDAAESHLGGYAFARSLGLSAIVPDSVAHSAFKRMFAQYSNGTNTGTWHAYTCAHFADLGIAIGSADSGMINHQADWNEYYNGHAAYVFWQNLDHAYTNCSYMTMPFVWRSLNLIEGYSIDMYRKILWIRPNLLTTMNKHLSGGVLPTANAWGTLDYAESASDPIQNITITYDKPVAFKTLILRNNTGIATPSVLVTKGGANVALTAATEGTGLDAIIRITFASDCAIDNSGINVKVFKSPQKAVAPARAPGIVSGIGQLKGSAVAYSISKSGWVSLDLFDVNGRHVSTLRRGSLTAGQYKADLPLKWSGTGVLRLIANGQSTVQRVIAP